MLSRTEGRGPGLMGVGSRENRKRGAFWRAPIADSLKGFAKKEEQKNGTVARERM